MFDEVEETSLDKAFYRFKDIFKYQNIIIYVITLFISSISFRNGFFAFGLAMVAACVGEEVPAICTYICALAGTYIGGGIAEVQTFFVLSIIYFVFVLLLRRKVAVEERNEQIKTGGKLFAAGVVLSLFRYFFHKYTFGELYMEILSFGLTYSFYKVFVNGIQCIKEFGIKKVFTIEEISATGVMFSLFFASFFGVTLFEISSFDIAVFLIVMYISWRHGIINGIICALAISICLLFVVPISIFQVELIIIASFAAGLLSYLGKFAVLGVLILATLVLKFGIDLDTIENVDNMILIKELCISGVGLLFMPNRRKIDIDEMINRVRYLNPTGDMRLREHKEPVDKKKNVMDMLSSLKNAHTRTDFEGFEVLVQDFTDSMESISDNIFYDIVTSEQTDIARDICKKLRDDGIIIDSELIEIFGSHNNYVLISDEKTRDDLQEVIKIANRTWRVFKENNPEIMKRNIDSSRDNSKKIEEQERGISTDGSASILNTNISTKVDETGRTVWAGIPESKKADGDTNRDDATNRNRTVANDERDNEEKENIENVVNKLLDDLDDLRDWVSIDESEENKDNNTEESSNHIDEFVTKTMMETAYKDDNLGNNVSEIIRILTSKRYKIEDCNLRKIRNGKYIAELKFDDADSRVKKVEIKNNIEDILSKNLGSKIVFQKERIEASKKKYYQIYSTEDNYVLQLGTARHTMDGQNYSIDSSIQIRLNDGKYLIAFVSNDKKTNDSRELNKSILKAVKQHTLNGFDGNQTPLILNSELNEEVVKDSRLDITILDLYLGSAHILKNNSVALYVKNKKNIYKLDVDKNMVLADTQIELKDGDILVMANKGIIESSDNEFWLQESLKSINTNNVQKMADLILEEAIGNSFGITHDDMMIAVAKIVRRKQVSSKRRKNKIE